MQQDIAGRRRPFIAPPGANLTPQPLLGGQGMKPAPGGRTAAPRERSAGRAPRSPRSRARQVGWRRPPARSIPRAPRKPPWPAPAPPHRREQPALPAPPRTSPGPPGCCGCHLQDQQPVALVAIVPIGFPGLDLQALGAGALPAVQGF